MRLEAGCCRGSLRSIGRLLMQCHRIGFNFEVETFLESRVELRTDVLVLANLTCDC